MRLARVNHGHALKQKLILAIIRLMSRSEPPDVIKTLFYRPNFWGGRFSALVNQVLRGPSEWSVGERELFAAHVSNLNRCRF